MSEFWNESCDSNYYNHPDNEKSNCARAVKLSNSFLVNSSYRDWVTDHGNFYNIKVPLAKRFVSYPNTFIFKPSENDKKGQSNYWRGNQHSVSKDYVLRIIGGCISDSRPRKRLDLFMTHSHVICVERSAEKNRDVDIHERIDLEPAQHLPLL